MVYHGGLCFLLFHFQTRRVMCAKSWLYVLMFDRLFTVCRVWRQHKQNCIFHVHWCTWKILLTSLSNWNFLFSFFGGLGGVSTVMLLFTGMQVKETQWLVGQQEVDMTGTCCLSCRPNRLIQIFPPLSELYANITKQNPIRWGRSSNIHGWAAQRNAWFIQSMWLTLRWVDEVTQGRLFVKWTVERWKIYLFSLFYSSFLMQLC